ncbi:MAG TPA: DegT/DnrJ/EryC1/StrS family aminotransferase [Gammaproteobacteria bacterium]|nr:DegT/DnrJ/EryC1/StrS family aminotransferase [Gammaproteobacteria bacterium]
MIPFIDLPTQQQRVRQQIDQAISRVLDHGQYIMGPEVIELEKMLAGYCQAQHAMSCSSGTDALLLILMALGLKPDQAVLVPSFTFAATAEVVALLGAKCVFVDVDPTTYNMCPSSLEQALSLCHQNHLSPAGIIAVDLFGQMADYPHIEAIAALHDLWVVADAAQSFGAQMPSAQMGQAGIATATSFFPAKPLGCYGDGGAIFTDNTELAEKIKSLRVHGQGGHRYDYARIGINGRLDTIQAAILLEKLKIYPEEVMKRQSAADHYHSIMQTAFKVPEVLDGCRSVWAQYTCQASSEQERAGFQKALRDQGVPSVVYYPKPLHTQHAYKHFLLDGQSLEVSNHLSQTVFSLPMHPYLKEEHFDLVAKAVEFHLENALEVVD